MILENRQQCSYAVRHREMFTVAKSAKTFGIECPKNEKASPIRLAFRS